jgi:uncharacterized protein (TIGR03435 family)
MSGVQYRHNGNEEISGMIRALACPSVFFATACALFAQQAPAVTAFDVASIKANDTSVRERHMMFDDISSDPATLTIRDVSLQGCIKWAYDIQDYQVSGPGWLNSEHFDITAKTAEPAAEAAMRQMLQKLLAERFGLKVHWEKKEMPAYQLVVAKGGPKFQPSQGEGKSNMSGARMVMNAKFTTMAQFAGMLSQPLQTPVIDMTGLKGQYDFKVDLTSYMPPRGDGARGPVPMGDPASIVLSLLPEQLGLKLESKKTVIDTLVIDHAEKTPTDN